MPEPRRFLRAGLSAGHFDRKNEDLNKLIAENNEMKQQNEIEARQMQGLKQRAEKGLMQLERFETSIVKKDALIKELDGKIAIQDNLIAVQQKEIERLGKEVNSRKCSGCGKQKQDVEWMYYLCCLCCHPIKPGQSIEEGLAACKER